MTAAVQSTWGDRSKPTREKLGNPTEWYVADDAASHTRYFVIQGSDKPGPLARQPHLRPHHL